MRFAALAVPTLAPVLAAPAWAQGCASSPRNILDERCTRGEIDRDEDLLRPDGIAGAS
jgi:hypothetical protein